MPLALILHLHEPSALADGPILLSLELKNAGAGDTAAPESGGPSPFEYSVYSADGSRLLHQASETKRRQADPWLYDDPPLSFGELTLPPGGTAVYEDDLTSLLTEPLDPGSYLLEASYRSEAGVVCTSPRVALDVLVSRPQAMAQHLSLPAGKIVIAEWHGKADGTTLLRQRDEGLGPLGRFLDLQTLETAGPVRRCATSLNAAYGILDGWRWLAWLDGDDLFAGVAHVGRWIYPTKPIRLDLEAASLLPFGYTTRDGGAIFVVAGRRGGRPHVRLVRIPAGRDAEPVLTDVRLEKLPDAVPSTCCCWTEAGPPEIVLVWTLEIHEATLILFGRVDALGGEGVAPPKGVFATVRPVLAVGVPPAIGPGERRRAQVLLGPATPGGSELTHVTFDMADPLAQPARELPRLPASAGGVDRWVLPSEPLEGVPLLAVAGPEIWASGGGAWTRIATGDVEPSSVRLWAFSPALVICSWFDRARGYRWRRLRL